MVLKSKWVRGLGGLVLTLAVMAALLFAFVVDREHKVPDWLRNRIELQANQMLGQGTVLIGDMRLRLGGDFHPRLVLQDVQVIDADARHLARVRNISGLISPRGVLLRRAVMMQEITISGARLEILRKLNGAVSVSFGTASGGEKQAENFAMLLDQSDEIFASSALEALETVNIDGMIVQYTDQRARKSWTVDGGQAQLSLSGDQMQLSGDFSLLTGRDAFTRLQFSLDRNGQSKVVQIAADLSDVYSTDIASQMTALAWLSALDATLSANLRTSLDEAGNWSDLFATLEIEDGALRPSDTVAPIGFDRVKAYVKYEPDLQKLTFEELLLEAQAGRMSVTGQTWLRDIADGVPNAFVGQFAAGASTLEPNDKYPEGLQFDAMQVDMRLRLDPFQIEVGQAVVQAPGAMLLAKGDVLVTHDGWRAAIDATIPEIGVAALKTYWPQGVKPKSREWTSLNLKDGSINALSAAIRIEQGAAPVVAAGWGFEGAQVKFMRHMPDITRAVGTVTVQDDQMFVSLNEGTIIAPQGGAVDLSGTHLTVTNMKVPGSDGVTSLQAEGPLPAVLSLLDQEPLSMMKKVNKTFALAQGRARIKGQIIAPLRKGVKPPEVNYSVSANLTDVTSRNIVLGRALVANNVDLKADNAGSVISGAATLDGVPTHIVWTKTNGEAHIGASNVSADVTLTPSGLATFGIALPPGMVSGRGQGKLDIALQAGQAPEFTLQSGLRGVALNIPSINWSKGTNASAPAMIKGRLGDVPQIDRFEIDGNGLRAMGDMTLLADGGVRRIRIQDLRVGDWLRSTATLTTTGKGQPMAVALAGGQLDLRKANLGQRGGEGGALDVQLDRIIIADSIALTDVSASLDSDGGLNGDFTGRVNGGARISGSIIPTNSGSAIGLTGQDAGRVAQAAGLLKNATGGAFNMTLMPTGTDGEFDGQLQVRGLRLREAPAIASLLDAISVIGLLRQLDGQGLAFDEVEARFRLTPEQLIITQSSAVGPGLGISLDGTYGLKTKAVLFQGVVSPFYLVNAIGALFTRKGEGLIGINFNIDGTTDKPQVSVNPLSAFTPGMFREIFRRPPPEVAK